MGSTVYAIGMKALCVCVSVREGVSEGQNCTPSHFRVVTNVVPRIQ